MLLSMTAFSRSENQNTLGHLSCEIRSINHRFLDIHLHLPDVIRPLEMKCRELIRAYVKRGKIDCVIRFEGSSDLVSLQLNLGLAKELCQAAETINQFLKNPGPICSEQILRFPQVVVQQNLDPHALEGLVVDLLKKTLEDLLLSRQREGEELKKIFLNKIDGLYDLLMKIKKRLPEIEKELREKLNKRFLEFKLELNNERLEQEILLLTQKMDVAEEIDRAHTHLLEVKRILKVGGSEGRRLDFFAQELNREANTIGSKSMDAEVTQHAINMKVLIEQIREQVQNIE